MSPRAADENANLVNGIKYTHQRPKYDFVPSGEFGLVVPNLMFFVVGQVAWIVSFVSLLHANFGTLAWTYFMAMWSGFGVTCGAHRLWSHRSYKAKLPLRIFLAIGQSIAGQNCLFIWCRDHRVHHKFSDTDADPHNSRRGVFFSHVGWLLHKKHPQVLEMGRKLDTEDLMSDPVVYWQRVFYYPIYAIFALFLPFAVPVFFWGESLIVSFLVTYVFRNGYVLHGTWFVNSAAHLWGDKPYNSTIPPADNSWVSMVTLGEGYHNYHHTFPFDYATSELPYLPNYSKRFIDLMQRWGQAYDLKRATDQSIQNLKTKTAGASGQLSGHR